LAQPGISKTSRGLYSSVGAWREDLSDGMLVAVRGLVHMVEKPKSLFKDALVGFVLGVLVVSGIAVATWGDRHASSHTR
jgi:hypothetical protein